MKVVVTGAGRGIGQRLAEVIKNHEVTAIVRFLDAICVEDSNPTYIPYSDRANVELSIKDSDCVIHCALDTKSPRKESFQQNLDLNKHILEQSLEGKCELFVYFSSQAVYSGIDQIDDLGYYEEQACISYDKSNDYTGLDHGIGHFIGSLPRR